MNQIQCMVLLSPKPVGMSEGPGGCAAIQLGWRTEQAGLSQKCRVLYLGRNTKGSVHTGDQPAGRQICTEGPQDMGGQEADHKLARHGCTKGRKQYPGLQDQLN